MADGYSYSEGYSYTTYTVNGKTYTSTQVKEYTRGTAAGYVNLGYRYDYDANGRITKVYWSSGGSYILQKEYAYDAKGQLVYEHSIDIS